MQAASIYHWAQEDPDRIAAIYNGRPVSYGVFARLIAATRAALADRGVSGAAVIASPSLFDVWVLGIALRSLGATTVIARKAEDIARIALREARWLAATGAASIPGLEDAARDAGLALVALTPEAVAGDYEPDGLDDRASGGHVLLTSGTTGLYKKVLIPASAEPTLNRRRREAFAIDRGSLVNLFDFGGWAGAGYKCAVAVWDAGGGVVIDQGRPRWHALASPAVTHSFVVPQMLGELLEAPPEALARRDGMGLYVTGGPLGEGLAEVARTRLTRRIFTHVGATETSTFAFTPVASGEDRLWHRLIPGRRVEVIDGAGRPCAPNVEGRLRVETSDGVEGYLDDPEATATHFQDGFFLTGDLAVIRADGRLGLRGRIGDVINVLGHKLPAGPIEEALRERLGVSGAAVISAPNARAEETVHVVLETPSPIASERLAEAIGEALLGLEAIEAHFWPALPRNHMGKVDRQILRARLTGETPQA